MEDSEDIMEELKQTFCADRYVNGYIYYLDYGDGFMDICTGLKLSNCTV